LLIGPFVLALAGGEDNRAEAHFTVTVRKAAEVNEGGPVAANVP